MIDLNHIVIDTSVVYKWFINEIYSDKALELRKRISQSETHGVIPDLLIYELANALRYNTDYPAGEIKKAITSLFNIELSIVTPVEEIIATAIDLAISHNITIYDSYFVALAQELGYTFITADMKLLRKIKSLKFAQFLGDAA
jgi:predicted nucleic acid-binding protein